jgi:tRNA modification GTPase
MILTDTIVALSTPPGVGAIHVVRLSGPDALVIGSQIFSRTYLDFSSAERNNVNSPADIEKNVDWQSHVACHGFIVDYKESIVIDEVVVTDFKAPRSYTGDDLLEISCHGGVVVSREIIGLCLRLGARLARPGEFTERAFLSGKLDLTQAEAVLDLIQAKTARQGRLSLSALSGVLGIQIEQIRNNLIQVYSAVVAGIDFPDEVGEADESEIANCVQASQLKLNELAKTARSGRFLRQGVRLAIVGRPNAGKSSLLNQLLKFERAIVTEIPGTTRDSIEELLDLNGIPIILVDTAGIRPTEDVVEKIGIERTIAAINQADLVLFVVDLLEGMGKAEEQILQNLAGKPFLIVANKADLKSDHLAKRNADSGSERGIFSQAISEQAGKTLSEQASQATCEQAYQGLVGEVTISALTGLGISDLTSDIEKWVFAGGSTEATGACLNDRQQGLAIKASQALDLVDESLVKKMPQDCLACDLKSAIDALSEICGEAVSEEVITQVFANFCIGK